MTPLSSSLLTQSLSELTEAFTDFKQSHKKQLQELDRLVHQSEKRIEKMDLSRQRPVLHTPHVSCAEFEHFVRSGQDPLSQKSLHGQTESQGGYLIPSPPMTLINQTLSDRCVVRQLASQTTIHSDALDLLLEKTETEAGWTLETSEVKETTAPELAKIRIPVHQIYAKPRVSQKLLEDAFIPIEQWICDKIADKFSKIETMGFLFGEGEGKPKGLLKGETCPLQKQEWGKIGLLKGGEDPQRSLADSLIEVLYSLPSPYLSGAVWLMPRSVAFHIARLKNDQDQYIWTQSLAQGHPCTLLGYPVHLCDEMAQEGQSTRIVFGNIKSAYQIVDRSQMSLLRDPFSAKPYVEFYATKRVGGDIVDTQALKYIDLELTKPD